jgi:hypothetical protein
VTSVGFKIVLLSVLTYLLTLKMAENVDLTW